MMHGKRRGEGTVKVLAHPMVVMKLDVKESSENRSSRQLLPTPARVRNLRPFGAGGEGAVGWGRRRGSQRFGDVPGNPPLSPMSNSFIR